MVAYARALSRVRRPEASRAARPATIATASSHSPGVKLSSRIRSAPASTTSRSWCRVSTSTSMARSGKASRTALKAWETPPAATTWLSFTKAASDRDMRWLTPPPQRTAYFSRARRPGVVLRVSRTFAPVSSSTSAHARVAVAMPDRRHRMFSALRSAVRRSRVRVVMDRSLSPAATRSPSSTWRSTSNSSSQTIETTASATRRPATTPASRATKSAVATASSGIVATVVTSTPCARSSWMATFAMSSTSTGSRPASARSSASAGSRPHSRYSSPPPQAQSSPQPPFGARGRSGVVTAVTAPGDG